MPNQNPLADNFTVVSVSPGLIQIEVIDPEKIREIGDDFTIGTYLKISDDAHNSIIAIVHSYRIKETRHLVSEEGDEEPVPPSFIVDAEPIGFLNEQGEFKRGGQQIAIPPNSVEIANEEILELIYSNTPEEKRFVFSELAQNTNIEVPVNGDNFFSKHIAVVGSTGSGKSGTVAKILQEGIKASGDQTARDVLNNSHIVIFDLHGEYGTAFPDAKKLDVNNLILPYWLMNSEELEELFIESNESNSHNQVSQFRQGVISNKEKFNPDREKISYDEPIYFSLVEVVNYITNLNNELLGKAPSEKGYPTIVDSSTSPPGRQEIKDRKKSYFNGLLNFVSPSTSKADKATGGPFYGDFERFIMRLNSKIDDDRLDFLLRPQKEDGSDFQTQDLGTILKQFVGYSHGEESNVTLLDLSGIPFEVLSIVVSLISRVIFDLCFQYKKYKNENSSDNDVPFLIVLEEAHNYIPKSEGARYKSVKTSIERIAKEGRKYGLSLMIVSQRPSEISETIFSQCNNFVSMRLTNPTDQNYIRRLMPDHISSITDTLPTLERQEAIIIGDSITIPSIVRIMDLEDKPSSADIDFHTEWKKDWYKDLFKDIGIEQ